MRSLSILLVKKQTDENNAVIVIDNSDITKPCSPMMEAVSDVRDKSTSEIKKGYKAVFNSSKSLLNVEDRGIFQV